jgi:hypothetical protein
MLAYAHLGEAHNSAKRPTSTTSRASAESANSRRAELVRPSWLRVQRPVQASPGEDKRLASQMTTYWVNYTDGGDPGAGLPGQRARPRDRPGVLGDTMRRSRRTPRNSASSLQRSPGHLRRQRQPR